MNESESNYSSPPIIGVSPQRRVSVQYKAKKSLKYDNHELILSLLPEAGFVVGPASNRNLFFLSLPLFGISLSWQCLFLLSAPYLQELEFDKGFSRNVWVIISVLGILITPFIGFISDLSTNKFGRRKPFIIIGLLLAVPNLLTFSFGGYFQEHINSNYHQQITLLTFFLGSAGLQILQGLIRTIISDFAFECQHTTAQAMGAVMMGIGKFVSSFVIYMTIVRTTEAMHLIFSVVMILLTLSTLPLIFLVQEVSLEGMNLEYNWFEMFTSTINTFRRMPKSIKLLSFIQVMGWCAWFSFILIAPDYYTDIFKSIDKGVEELSFQFIFESIVEIFVAGFIPYLLNYLPFHVIYSTGFLILTFCLTIISQTSNSKYLTFSVLFLGIPSAFTNTFPYSYVGKEIGSGYKLGVFMGFLNTFTFAPILISFIYIPFLHESEVILFGACWAFIAMIGAVFIRSHCEQKTFEIIV